MSFKITPLPNPTPEIIGSIKINQNQNFQNSKNQSLSKKRGINANPLKIKPIKKNQKKKKKNNIIKN